MAGITAPKHELGGLLPPTPAAKPNADGEIPTIQEMASTIKTVIIDKVISYHKGVTQTCAVWATSVDEHVKALTTHCFKWCPYTAVIAGAIGRAAAWVAFFALHFLHVVPYLAVAGALALTSFLFYTSPVALITGVSGIVIILQTLIMYHLYKGVKNGTKVLEQESDKFIVKVGEESDKFRVKVGEESDKVQKLFDDKLDKMTKMAEEQAKEIIKAVSISDIIKLKMADITSWRPWRRAAPAPAPAPAIALVPPV